MSKSYDSVKGFDQNGGRSYITNGSKGFEYFDGYYSSFSKYDEH